MSDNLVKAAATYAPATIPAYRYELVSYLMSTEPVRINEEEGRFELTVDGHTAFITFSREGDTMTLIHTEVPDELEGRGVGSAVVRGALDYVRGNELKLIPECGFVKSYLKRHPEEAEEFGIDPSAF